MAERIIKNPNLSASTEKWYNWVSSKICLDNTFSYTYILSEEVLTELVKLNIHKSSCLDGVRPNILTMSAIVIYESLTHMVNLSRCTGSFPYYVKLATITPLYKSGDNAYTFVCTMVDLLQ